VAQSSQVESEPSHAAEAGGTAIALSALLALAFALNLVPLISAGFTIAYSDRLATSDAFTTFDMRGFVVASAIGAALATAVPIIGLLLSWRVQRAAELGAALHRPAWTSGIALAFVLLVGWSTGMLPAFAGSSATAYGMYPGLRIAAVAMPVLGVLLLAACAWLTLPADLSRRGVAPVGRVVFWSSFAWALVMLAALAVDFLFLVWWAGTGSS
jgi:hypothetical protein